MAKIEDLTQRCSFPFNNHKILFTETLCFYSTHHVLSLDFRTYVLLIYQMNLGNDYRMPLNQCLLRSLAHSALRYTLDQKEKNNRAIKFPSSFAIDLYCFENTARQTAT